MQKQDEGVPNIRPRFCLSLFTYCTIYWFTFACHTPVWSQMTIPKNTYFDSLKSYAHFGFALFDPESKSYVYEWQSDLYFLPASNTKLLTYFVADSILTDSIPTYQACDLGESVVIIPFGDPSFLNPKFPTQMAFAYLQKATKTLYLDFRHFRDSTYGEGWMWDDYSYPFATEKAPLPIYGNLLELRTDERGNYKSNAFAKQIQVNAKSSKSISRSRFENTFSINPEKFQKNRHYRVPFRWSVPTALKLLADTLHKPVHHSREIESPLDCKTVHNTTKKTLFQQLLQNSDNLVAEQLLLLSSQVRLNYMNTRDIIRCALKNHFSFLTKSPIWIDGSGVSRYNLITPKTLVEILFAIYRKKNMQSIQEVFAKGNKGTLKQDFGSYIMAKTGTLRNQFCLSGFLQDKKGKWWIFSIMTNHFSVPNEDVLRWISGLLDDFHNNK